MYVIKYRPRMYVLRFDAQHQVVTMATSTAHAKRFKTADAAQEFINKYADAGYGFVSVDASVQEA